jgi:dUTP pyrophosphatase
MRSGISSNTWLGLSNSVGVIDSDYRGDIKLFIRNYSPSKRFTINNGDRIAQLLIVDCFTPTLLNSKNLSVTERNTSGFGSTGVK